MDIRKVAINELIPATYNPRKDLKKGDAEYQKIKRSIETFGYIDPIIANSDMTVIGGHQRLKVLKDLGFKEVEVVFVNLDKDHEKALNIALNKIGGDWDAKSLDELIGELNIADIDVELTGFDMEEVEKLLGIYKDKEAEEDEFDADAELQNIEEPKSQRGQVYKLGRHRIMCGDSTSADDVSKLMGERKADMLLTDPPYNVAYEGKTKEALTIENDKMSAEKFREFLASAFRNGKDSLKAGGVFCIWHASLEGYNFRGACIDVGLQIRQVLVWTKNSLVIGRSDYQWKHEPCLYGWKDGASHLWASDRKQTSVLEFDRPTKNKDHPTMKPVKLFDYQIKNNTKGEDIVLDLFMGSGTTLVACEQNGRTAYGMEYDPKYCDVIIKRWEALTGLKAELV